MFKATGCAVALTLALSVSASAEELTGRVNSIDRADHEFVLADNTRLWTANGLLNDVTLGDVVQVQYSVAGDKKIATDLKRSATLSYRSVAGTDGVDPIDPIQSE